MPTLPQVARTVFEEALLLDSEPARACWLNWRAQIEANDFDGDVVLYLPLLGGRLAQWSGTDAAQHPDQTLLVGICKRAWAQSQLRLGSLARALTVLQEHGVEPRAVSGAAAWAIVYRREQSLRPLTSIELMVSRRDALNAQRLLEGAGWRVAAGSPKPEGRALDEFRGLWFYDDAELPLHLVWRLRDVPPDLASEHEAMPSTRSSNLGDIPYMTLTAEELLLDALTRQDDETVSWYCDAIVLLRNEAVDWRKVCRMLRGFPDATVRLRQLHEERSVPVPAFLFEPPDRGYVSRRLSALWVDSRQVAWKEGHAHTISRFLRYGLWRLMHGIFHSLEGSMPVTVIDASSGTGSWRVAEYIHYRTLFVFLAMRDVRLRYKRTWRGVLWALLQSLLPMLIFVAIFARVIRPELHIGPYWLFVLAGLAPWNFFANSVNYGGATFVSNLNLVNKVYFPRAILPLAAVAACVVDLLVATAVLLPVGLCAGARPGLSLLALPLALLWVAILAAIVGTAAASVNLLNRDLKPLVPFLVQVWMYATPVLYPLAMVPQRWRFLFWLNPMTGVVESFRAAVLHEPWDMRGAALSFAVGIVVLAITMLLFLKVEADVAELI